MSRLMHAPDTLYWALLPGDAGVVHSTHGESSLAGPCLEALQHEVPAPLDELAICLVPTEDGRTLACAVPRERLAGVASHVLAAGPEVLPDFAPPGVEPADINFLQGSLEPAAFRAARRWRTAFVLGCLAWLGVVLGVGLHRRTQAWQEQAQRTRAATEEVLRSAMNTSGPRAMQDLVESVERLTRASKVNPRDVVEPDASLTLERWMASIADSLEAEDTAASPRETENHAVLRSIRVMGDRVDISLELITVAVPSEGWSQPTPDATARVGAWLAAWMVPEGWTIGQPRLQVRDGAVQIDVSARRSSLDRNRSAGGTP